MLKRAVIAVLFVLMVTSITQARELQGVDMPETIQVSGTTVALNGLGLRAVLFIKPYVGGLYLTGPATDGGGIMAADDPMAIRLHMIDDVGQKMMVRSLYNGMRNSVKSTGDDFDQIRDRVENLKSFFDDEIKEGDIYEFKYQPSKGLEIVKNEKLRGVIEGLDFKKAFFGIWLNSDSPADKDLRQAMLAGDMQVDIAQLQKTARNNDQAQAAPAEETPAETLMAKADTRKEKQQQAVAEETKAADQQPAKEETAASQKDESVKAAATSKAAEQKAPKVKAVPEKKAKATEKKPAASAPGNSAKVEEKKADAPSEVDVSQVENQAIYFGFNDASLSNSGSKKLDRKIEWMKANPDAKVLVEVYADPRGSSEYNMQLSKKRANSVKTYMTGAGIESSRIETKVYGEENQGSSDADMAKSRRAQFRVIQ